MVKMSGMVTISMIHSLTFLERFILNICRGLERIHKNTSQNFCHMGVYCAQLRTYICDACTGCSHVHTVRISVVCVLYRMCTICICAVVQYIFYTIFL